MKYIVLQVSIGDSIREIPFVFPNILIHNEVSKYMENYLFDTHGWISKPISAGECSFYDSEPRCGGHSETLNLHSRGYTDSVLIKQNDYGAGII